MSGPGNYPDSEKTRLFIHNQSDETSEFFKAPDLVGTLFEGRFRVDSFIGAGGSGQVYKCTDLSMQRPVALKILSGHLDAKTVRRFQTEAVAISRLSHPNLVSIHEFGMSQNNQPFIVMEFIEGQSLADLLKKEVRLKPARCVELFTPVFDALQLMHEKGVVHRDLKPGNIIVSNIADKQIARVVDFGIAKILSETADGQPQLTQTGEIFGSPLYMSPEQARGTKVDIRTDQYSLGCLIFECLTGTTPHVGRSSIETLLKHQSEEIPSLREASMGEKFPAGLETVLTRLLAKDPAARFGSMSEARAAFKNSLLASSQSNSKVLPSDSSHKNASGSRLLIACSVLALLAVSGFAIALLKGNNDSATVPVTTSAATSGKASSTDAATENLRKEFQLPKNVAADPSAYSDEEMPANDAAFVEFMRKNLSATDIRVNPDISDERVKQENFLVFNRDIDKGAMRGFDKPLHIQILLILNCHRLGDDGMEHIMHLPLTDVNLTRTQVGDLTAKKLLKIKTLEGLDLKATKITNDALVQPSANLKHLLISDTAVDDAGCAYMPAFKNLAFIDLAGTKITSAGIKSLSKMNLNGLWISRTGITDSAGDSIASMTHLFTLDVSQTQVSDAFLRKIAHIKSLHTLLIQECGNLTPSGIRAFQMAKPNCQIFKNARQSFEFLPKAKEQP